MLAKRVEIKTGVVSEELAVVFEQIEAQTAGVFVAIERTVEQGIASSGHLGVRYWRIAQAKISHFALGRREKLGEVRKVGRYCKRVRFVRYLQHEFVVFGRVFEVHEVEDTIKCRVVG